MIERKKWDLESVSQYPFKACYYLNTFLNTENAENEENNTTKNVNISTPSPYAIDNVLPIYIYIFSF